MQDSSVKHTNGSITLTLPPDASGCAKQLGFQPSHPRRTFANSKRCGRNLPPAAGCYVTYAQNCFPPGVGPRGRPD